MTKDIDVLRKLKREVIGITLCEVDALDAAIAALQREAAGGGEVWAPTCPKCRMTIVGPNECAIGGQHCQCPAPRPTGTDFAECPCADCKTARGRSDTPAPAEPLEGLVLADGLGHMARHTKDGSDKQFLLAVKRFLHRSADREAVSATTLRAVSGGRMRPFAYSQVDATEDPDMFVHHFYLLPPGHEVPAGCEPLYTHPAPFALATPAAPALPDGWKLKATDEPFFPVRIQSPRGNVWFPEAASSGAQLALALLAAAPQREEV